MINYVGSRSEYTCDGNSSHIAKALASKEGWNSYSSNCVVGNCPSANNATGFSAVPAGYCNGSSFGDAFINATFWCSTQDSNYTAWSYSLYYSVADVIMNYNYLKLNGFSVRCLRD